MFGKKKARASEGGLPGNIVELMQEFGQYEFSPMNSSSDPARIWGDLVASLYTVAQEDSPRFLRELSDAVLPAGGWAVYGGAHLVWEVLGGDVEDPHYDAMMDASLEFLRHQGVSMGMLKGYESWYWRSHRGQAEGWIPQA